MAEKSITLSVAQLYQYMLDDSNSRCYYRNLNQDYQIIEIPKNRDEYYLAVRIPSLKALLGRHIIYSVDYTFRAVAPLFDQGLWNIVVQLLQEELPTDNPGYEYILAPRHAHDNGPFYSSIGTIEEPGTDTTILGTHFAGSVSDISRFAANVLRNRYFLLRALVFGPAVKIYSTLTSGHDPVLTIHYNDSVVVEREFASVSGITSGYWNPRFDQKVSWLLKVSRINEYSSVDTEINPVHETIYWRVQGANNWTSINVPDYSSSFTVVANTFPVGETIEWYVSVVDEDGITSNSETFTISTDDDVSTATPVSPVNSIELGNGPIPFIWTVSNPTGAPPTRVKASWTPDPETGVWTELFDFSEAVYSFNAEPNTFPGGNIYWKVTSYNADGEEGPTSDPAVFSVIAPPSPPTNVAATSAPFSTISWQAEVQTAFEISIDGIPAVKKFGAGVYNYQLPEPLPDGEHTISVRVQGAYGYWSTPTSTMIAIENESSGAVDIAGSFGIDANIVWNYSLGTSDTVYRVYRDGKLIYRTNNTFLLDRFVLGNHSYSVLVELEGGYYCRSEEVSGNMRSNITRIAPAIGGDWLELKLSENSSSMQSFEWLRSVVLRHYAGSAYPVAEFSPFEDRLASYDCAFSNVEEAKAFERMRSQVVILKSRGGEVVIGPLSVVSKTAGDFYIAYHFSVSQIHWEDFTDDTIS